VTHVGADAAHRLRELRDVHRQHQRMEPVRPQIADDAGAVVPVLPPAEEPLGTELALRRLAEPRLPVDDLWRQFRLDRVVPFALRTVAAVAALRPEERAELTALGELARL